MTEEKILDRVRKLLNLANDERASEGERDNALRMAYNTLAKYNLDMADVDSRQREKDDPRGRFTGEGWSLTWSKHIRQTVAKLFMCEYYFGRKVNGTRCVHHWVGRESNATTAMYMSDYIITSILKEARALYKHNLAPESRAFAVGASDRLRERVAMLREAKTQELRGSGRDLVLVDIEKAEKDANVDFINGAGTKLKIHKARSTKIDTNAYEAGREYGDRVSLNTQIKGTDASKKLR